MWAILAVIAFLAAQAYLLYCLKKTDSFFSNREEQEEKEILSLSFADPAMAERMTRLLADFSRENPEIEMVLHTDSAVPDAVREGRSALGFLAERDGLPGDLSGCTLKLTGLSDQRVVWKTGARPDCASAFMRYLRQSGGNPM